MNQIILPKDYDPKLQRHSNSEESSDVGDFMGYSLTCNKENRGFFINTISGIKFYPLHPKIEDITILDIAHALGNIARFTGHTRKFYSVAQHSIMVSKICKPENALYGLLHDGSEAYISDLSRPIKTSPGMEFFKTVEKKIQDLIYEKFHLSLPVPEDIKIADNTMFITEARSLTTVPFTDEYWGSGWPTPLEEIHPLTPEESKFAFLERYYELTHRTILYKR
jgi:hypothetical protein